MSFRSKSRRRVTYSSKLESRTIQSSRDECDINKLMAKYSKTGMITHLAKHPPRFEDVSKSVPYQEALNIVMSAQESFMGLSAAIRSRFDNDPGRFLAFATDPANQEELYELGIAQRKPVAPPIDVNVVPAPVPDAKV